MKTIELIMILAFVGGLVISLYKIYLFLPQKPLADDDTTPESVTQLEKIMVESNTPDITEEELFEKMHNHPEFDTKHFWRFNPNRLRHLINNYRLKEPNFRL
ncbi:MAG: hypothetical protein PHU41_07560 [Sulfuricurvum sp.]|nr:hypothetical protein [Sulfuricurvum sp.]